jgi:multicomponent Na+:H+ antiporter subunit A
LEMITLVESDAALALWLSTLAVAVPFVGALLVAIACALGSPHSRFIPTVALLATILSAGAVGWLWTIDSDLTWRLDWIAALGIGFGWRVDALSLLFAGMAAAFALLTTIFSSVYLPRMHHHHHARWHPGVYYAALLTFTGAMLGLALSEDLFQLYLFWEVTDIASFALIGLDWRNPAARRAATKALTITALGGLALLLGFVGLAASLGTSSIPAIVDGGKLAIDAGLASLIAFLFVVAAATKSAQFPFYVWLPNAMIAPTPVNAFLDSAALVAAGIFLAARFTPIFEGIALWATLLIAAGVASMVLGGLLATQQRNLKWLLAYSTLSLFGFIFVLAGVGHIFAALWFLLQHAILKGGLFLIAGIVEENSAASRSRPLLILAGILAFSLVGLPPFAGFWMKEGFLAALLHDPARPFLAAVGVASAALTLIYMVRFLRLAFHTQAGDEARAGIAWPMVVPVLILAAATLLFGIVPQLARPPVEAAAIAVTGQPSELEFTYHLNLELLLSMAALALGALLYWTRSHWQSLLSTALGRIGSLDTGYWRTAERAIDLGRWIGHVQNGSLHRYLSILLAALMGLMGFALPALRHSIWFVPGEGGPWLVGGGGVAWATILLLLLIILGTLLTVTVRTHLRMVLALGMVGFMIAALFALLAAPNLGLVQVHVETLATVLFILILVRVPHHTRRVFEEEPQRLRSQPQRSLRVALAALFGLLSAGLSWLAINHQPSAPVALWYNENTRQLVGAEDIVAAILVHFRALDTLGEIIVFAIATLGVLVLMRRIREESS